MTYWEPTAFVWCNQDTNTIEIAADAVGNRLVYYTKRGDVVYFSSLLEPLRLIAPDVELNDRWMLDFLSMDYLSMISETEENPDTGHIQDSSRAVYHDNARRDQKADILAAFC